MIVFTHTGDFKQIEKFFKTSTSLDIRGVLELYGNKGVDALAANTPSDSGLTASSWKYEVHITRSGYSINWTNSNVIDGIPIAVLIQYGHGTRNGGYLQGRDYINPAIQPLFDMILQDLWKEVTA